MNLSNISDLPRPKVQSAVLHKARILNLHPDYWYKYGRNYRRFLGVDDHGWVVYQNKSDAHRNQFTAESAKSALKWFSHAGVVLNESTPTGLPGLIPHFSNHADHGDLSELKVGVADA